MSRHTIEDDLDEIDAALADDIEIDRKTLRLVVAIGKIELARFNNVDEQLDRIEGKVDAIAKHLGIVSSKAGARIVVRGPVSNR